jgi:hypothetical protein
MSVIDDINRGNTVGSKGAGGGGFLAGLLGGFGSMAGGSSGSGGGMGIPTSPSEAAKMAMAAAPDALKAIFTKEGVSPSFFANFGWLDFADNSTGKWKSRFAKMQVWTADQRAAWYANELATKNNSFDAVQYSQLYGTMHDQIDDTKNVSFPIADAYNNVLLSKYLSGNEKNSISGFTGTQLLIDLTKTAGYSARSVIQSLTTAGGNISAVSRSIPWNILALICLPVIGVPLFLILEKRKK